MATPSGSTSTVETSQCGLSSSTRRKPTIPIVHPNASARKPQPTSHGCSRSVAISIWKPTSVTGTASDGSCAMLARLRQRGSLCLVNEALVRAGYAAFSTFPPDVKYVAEKIVRRSSVPGNVVTGSGPAADDKGDTNELSGNQAISAGRAAVTSPIQTGRSLRPGKESSPIPASAAGCEPSYPDVCIPPSPPDLDCGDVAYRRFTVYPPDPHRFDGDTMASAVRGDHEPEIDFSQAHCEHSRQIDASSPR